MDIRFGDQDLNQIEKAFKDIEVQIAINFEKFM